ncbi:MAG: hypothetical protein FJW40_25140 [Acidobacteria bacterium]|nr:hypothetical protein [Acidobacteriota bacterium]
MSPLPLIQQLDQTAGSIALRESILVYPLIETTHVLALCLFLGIIALLDLRLLGLGFQSVPVSQIAGRLLPIGLTGFALMTLSGLLLFYSGPLRAYGNIFFRVKMVLILLAGLNAVAFHYGIYKRIAAWDTQPVPPPRARLAGLASLILWCAIVICGRMQAYNWFEKPPGT